MTNQKSDSQCAQFESPGRQHRHNLVDIDGNLMSFTPASDNRRRLQTKHLTGLHFAQSHRHKATQKQQHDNRYSLDNN
ncbi:unnamed protein product [Protopolystoma xenopodis]|uniref:Uncharacterized protein n=1 Tax=Protopolystoma xenopodis TaxID=117903 RepID=A0A448XB01_9PLAT|nr:unnamed protein product [Protopolystoma xenopodis]